MLNITLFNLLAGISFDQRKKKILISIYFIEIRKGQKIKDQNHCIRKEKKKKKKKVTDINIQAPFSRL